MFMETHQAPSSRIGIYFEALPALGNGLRGKMTLAAQCVHGRDDDG